MKRKLEILREKLQSNKILINKNFFFESAVLLPLIKNGDEYELLFQVRSRNIRQGGEISFPGGKTDNTDKDFTETAIRETCEELGVKENEIEIYGYLGSYLNPMGVLVHAILGELKIENPEKLNVSKDEVEEIFTAPLEFFINSEPEVYYMQVSIEPFGEKKGGEKISFPASELGLDEKYAENRKGITYPVYVYKTNGKIIWGITAYLVKYFIDRIKKID